MSKAKALLFDLSSSVSYGRLSLLGKVLFPMLVLKSDDQGRGLAEADAIKWKVCPNVPELTIEAIEGILQEMAEDRIDLLHLYQDGRNRKLYQFKRWWQPDIGSGSCLQWARPSEYQAPDNWVDRVRMQQGPGKSPLVLNWDTPGGFVPAELPNDIPNELPNQEHGGQYNLTKPKVIQPKEIPAPDGAPPPEPEVKPRTPHQAMFGALLTVYKWDSQLITEKQRGRLNSEAKRLLKADKNPRDVWAAGEWWWENDWRGKKGSTPTYSQLVETLGKVEEAAVTGPAELGAYQ